MTFIEHKVSMKFSDYTHFVHTKGKKICLTGCAEPKFYGQKDAR
jgi:hypothetical protein